MFSLPGLRFVFCSRDLNVLRAQRIIGFFILITHKSTGSENHGIYSFKATASFGILGLNIRMRLYFLYIFNHYLSVCLLSQKDFNLCWQNMSRAYLFGTSNVFFDLWARQDGPAIIMHHVPRLPIQLSSRTPNFMSLLPDDLSKVPDNLKMNTPHILAMSLSLLGNNRINEMTS